MSNSFPTLCVDDFYRSPNKIREFALSLPYDNPDNNIGFYPGKRTKELCEVDLNFFNAFCEKLFSLYFDFLTPLKYHVSTSFQLIYPMAKDASDCRNSGWIHTDYSKEGDPLFAGIIYLTPNINVNCGTSIFKYKENNVSPIVSTDEIEKAKSDFFVHNNFKNYEKIKKTVDDSFIETIRFNNIYNRLITFDAKSYHAANNFYSENKPRLTQVFFVNSVSSSSGYPLDRCYSSRL